MDCIDLKTVTMFVLGGSQNGRTEWADDRGVLDQAYRNEKG